MKINQEIIQVVNNSVNWKASGKHTKDNRFASIIARYVDQNSEYISLQSDS
jgi:hypothetical protein